MNDSVISLFVNGTVSLPWVTGGGGRWPLAELSSWSRCRTGPATAWCADVRVTVATSSSSSSSLTHSPPARTLYVAQLFLPSLLLRVGQPSRYERYRRFTLFRNGKKTWSCSFKYSNHTYLTAKLLLVAITTKRCTIFKNITKCLSYNTAYILRTKQVNP